MGAKDGGDEVPFVHRSNIHEQRFAAYFCRSFPLLFLVTLSAVVVYSFFRFHVMLLWLSALFNTALWLFACSIALLTFGTVWRLRRELTIADAADFQRAIVHNAKGAVATFKDGTSVGTSASHAPAMFAFDSPDSLVHLIVLPNYKEDEALLAQTLQALAEAHHSSYFRIMLAMEDREEGAREKAERLVEKFKRQFTKIYTTYHPANLIQEHQDGTSNAEVAGKASNLKWAVRQAYEELLREGGRLSPSSVMVTVADADCIFHPSYFRRVGLEFNTLKASPGSRHLTTMWQAPQLPFRNFYSSPVVSRVWGYIASLYEFGGVGNLGIGGQHLVFSAYSLSLQLAISAQAWDGDVIAEDHHCYIKCYFHALRQAVVTGTDGGLQVRPIFLPVKSTSVISPDGYWPTWVERWHQAKRHAQGVAELSYAMLVFIDYIRSVPLTFTHVWQSLKLLARLFAIHLLPIGQTIPFVAVSVYWFVHNRHVPECPDRIWLVWSDGHFVLCGLAGGWALMWPMVVPLFLLILGNLAMLSSCLLEPVSRRERLEAEVARNSSEEDMIAAGGAVESSLWHREDGRIPPTFGSKRLTLCLVVIGDCVLFLGPIMIPYGQLVAILSYWSVCIYGNRVKYVTAAKALEASSSDYGTLKLPTPSDGSTSAGSMTPPSLE